jgi:hypothetical protein
MKQPLQQAIKAVSALTEIEVNQMFQRMSENYKDMRREVFLSDLRQKSVVLLLMAENEIQGFSTFVANPKGCGTSSYNILFSGDTIISPLYWGSTALADGWFKVVASFLAADTSKPWYWFLMSKGHRTYMYLPLFFHQYYPALEAGCHDASLFKIADAVASKLYPAHWRPEVGVIQFPQAAGALSHNLAKGTYARQHNPHVAFFLDRNPSFAQGDELVCICPLHPENLKRSFKQKLQDLMTTEVP